MSKKVFTAPQIEMTRLCSEEIMSLGSVQQYALNSSNGIELPDDE